ncbi:MAG: hypothetical protein ACI8ZB_005181 [Desulforhopalus sp.]
MNTAGKIRFPREFLRHITECDTTADIAGIEELQNVSTPDRFNFLRVPKHLGVSHASLVLKDPIPKHGEPLEKPNPMFQEMMEAIAAFSGNGEGCENLSS